MSETGTPLAASASAVLPAIAAQLHLRLLVVFGSRATGSPPPGPPSDVDLAVVFRRGAPRATAGEVASALAPLFPGLEVDVVVLHGVDPLLRWEALRHGQLLYGDPLDHLEYRAFAYKAFEDADDLRALERTLSDRRLAWVREQLRAAP
jgi:predicted nucleotidyltransferase